MLGIAVVGAGRWGKNLVRNFAAVEGSELRRICDTSESIRSTMSNLYPGVELSASFDEVLADSKVDAVVIALEAPLHFEFARRALDAGKHTYVEKPLTLSGKEAQTLVELADRVDRKLMVGHLLEYHPAVNYVKALIEDEKLGDALYLYLQRLNLGIVRKAENAWWSLAPHDVSLACYLFDDIPVSVSASGHDYLQNGIEDVVFANLKFADGRMAHIHVSWLDPHKIRKATLVGSQKMVVFDDMEASEKIRIFDKAAEVGTVASYEESITLRSGDIVIPKTPGGEPLKIECQHFIDSIRNNEIPRSDGRDGLRVVRVLEAGMESLRRGGELVHLDES